MLPRDNSIYSLNVMRYKRFLSPFGQNVLSTLLSLRSEAARNGRNTSQIQLEQRFPQQGIRKNIRYNNAQNGPQGSLIFQHGDMTPKANNDEGSKPYNTTPSVTSMHLLRPVTDVTDPNITTYNNLYITSKPNDNNVVTDPKIALLLSAAESDKNNNVQNDPFCAPFEQELVNNPNNVDWEDFFDRDLLSDLNINDTRDERNDEIFTIHFPNESKINTKLQDKNKVVKKRKLMQKNVSSSKKIKTVCDTGLVNQTNDFRKKKYTTAVKDWLTEIYCDGDVFDEQNNTVDTGEREETGKASPKITINKSVKKDKVKKTVQARLANKDGVMKYAKPKNAIENPSVELDKSVSDAEPIASHVKDKMPKANKTPKKETKVKDKTSKAKFTAPIKSDIPVKDVSSAIITVKDTNLDECRAVLQNLKNQNVFATLVYSNGFSQLNNHHTDDSCTAEGIMISFNDIYYYFKGYDDKLIDVISAILDANIVSYDAKNIIIYLISNFKVDIDELKLIVLDTKIGASLLDPDHPPENFSEVQKLLNFKPDYTIATECVLQKCAWYMTLMAQCAEKLHNTLVERELWKLFADIEMRVLPIIAVMEHRGVCVDLDRLKSMESILLKRTKAVEQECHKAAGKSFQVNSALQVRTILYDELQLDTKCKVKIRETICQGAKSTSETMLRSLQSQHPLPKLILEYRRLHKAHATFLAGIAPHVIDGIIRPTWIQTAAATGRIACSSPNLQAIPKTPFELSSDGDEASSALRFRSVYVARPGFTLVAADFKHVECRVFAHQAADSALLAALASPDLFRELAATWLNKSSADVTSEERERTKRIVYASLYGAGGRKLMDILDVPYDRALAVLASFNRTFPSLKSFGRWVVTRCEENGGILKTASGRMRTFQNISSNDFAAKSHAERQAVNFLVQGVAADICKLAMAASCGALRAGGVRGARLLLQLHDELVWELPLRQLRPAAQIIKSTMEGCGRELGMNVSLPVALRQGRTWGNLEDFDI